jgi:hypothetical protein
MIQQGVGQQATRQRQPDRAWIYNADSFTLNCLEGWQDTTVFTIAGPVEDNIQHSVVIALGRETPFTSVREFAEWQISSVEDQLKGSRLLKKGSITLSNGTPAYQAIFVWYPTDGLRIYQEQIFVLSEGSAYTLTATFSKKTRKTLGPQVERMMLSFNPVKPKARMQGAPR